MSHIDMQAMVRNLSHRIFVAVTVRYEIIKVLLTAGAKFVSSGSGIIR